MRTDASGANFFTLAIFLLSLSFLLRHSQTLHVKPEYFTDLPEKIETDRVFENVVACLTNRN